jgi:DNA repair protein RadC
MGGAVRPVANAREGGPRASTAALLAAILDPGNPLARLPQSHQVMACGLAGWVGPAGESRARGLGLSPRQAVRVRVLAELVGLLEAEGWAMPAPITGPADVLAHVGDIRGCTQEKVVAIYLDSRNRPLSREVVAVGGLRSSVLQPRDVLAPALTLPAAALILAHNHPSGDTRPSPEDLEVTRQLAAAARLMGLELLDHLVVARTGYSSIKEQGGCL